MMTAEQFITMMVKDYKAWSSVHPRPESHHWLGLEEFATKRFNQAYDREVKEQIEFFQAWARDGFGGAD